MKFLGNTKSVVLLAKMSDVPAYGYLVYSEQWYGGERKRVFGNATSAVKFASAWLKLMKDNVDILIQPYDLNTGLPCDNFIPFE